MSINFIVFDKKRVFYRPSETNKIRFISKESNNVKYIKHTIELFLVLLSCVNILI